MGTAVEWPLTLYAAQARLLLSQHFHPRRAMIELDMINQKQYVVSMLLLREAKAKVQYVRRSK